ncbi:MAG: hypothetical protein KAT69_07910 [Candidatus Aminicenantes bacterium]|nr:hypothetical protein [Candidatus Aminicenantes bacterium]
MSFKLSVTSQTRLLGVNPDLLAVTNLAIKITVIDFGIPPDGGIRTAERQKELYDKKVSKADGYNNLSNHQSGDALDFYAYVDGKASWESHHLAMVACAHLQAASMMGVKINWGGFWQRKTPKYKNGIPYGWDMAHIERSD